MILAIDTSGAFASVALAGDDWRVVAEAEGGGERSHAEEIDSLVKKVLAEARCEAKEIRRIVLGEGPGSFTGLRIGFAFVQGMALGRELRIHLVPSAVGVPSRRVLAPAGKSLLFESVQSLLLEGGSSSIVSTTDVRLPLDDCYTLAPIPELPSVPLARNIGGGLLLFLAKRPESYLYEGALSDLVPNYLRSVAAKTIAERL